MQGFIANYNAIASDDLSKDLMQPCLKEAQADKAVSYAGELSGKKVLDIGVGKGLLLDRCNGAFKVGLDIAPAYLKYSCEKGEMVRAFGEHLPFKPESFDAVFLTDVLEHALDPADLLNAVREVLKRDGVMVVRVPDREDLRNYKDAPYEFVHLRNFNKRSLRYLLGRCGFKVKRVEYDSFVQYRPSVVTTLCHKLARGLQRAHIEIYGLTWERGWPVTLLRYWFDRDIGDINHLLCRLPNWAGRLACRPVELAMVCGRVR